MQPLHDVNNEGQFIIKNGKRTPLRHASVFQIYHEPIYESKHSNKSHSTYTTIDPYSHQIKPNNQPVTHQRKQNSYKHFHQPKKYHDNKYLKRTGMTQYNNHNKYLKNMMPTNVQKSSTNRNQNNANDNPQRKKCMDDVKREHECKEIKTNTSYIINENFKKCINKQTVFTMNDQLYVDQKNDEYYRGYLYHIQLAENKTDYGSIGILLPKQIPNSELSHITFPVQIETRIEEQLMKNIKYFTSNNLTQKVEIDAEQIMIKLNLISPHDTLIEHRLKINAFHKIEKFHQFICRLWDEKLKISNQPERFYFLVPLKKTYDKSSFEIDFEYIKRTCLGAEKTLNVRKWKQFIRSDLKNELVQIIRNNHSQLFISYGITKNACNDEKDDDIQSMDSVFFADKAMIDGWKAMNVNNKQKEAIVIRKANTNIKNVLNVHHRMQSGHQLQQSLEFHALETVFPTGITSQMWNTLTILPAILWRIDHWLNIIHLKKKLNLDVDIILLFQAMHRDRTSTNNSYQILNNLGSYIIKAMTTLYKFSTNPNAEQHTIREYVENRTDKIYGGITHYETYKILIKVAKQCNILQYAILKQFKFNRWHPPGCKYRENNSLYFIGSQLELVNDGHGKNRYLGAYLIQSIVGACFYSSMNKLDVDKTTLFSRSINSSLKLLHNLGLTEKQFFIADEFSKIRMEHMSNECLNLAREALKTIAISPNTKPNPILNASLMAVCHKITNYGITLERLAILGDSLLDMFVVWHICRSIGYQVFIPQIVDKAKNSNRIEWRKYITDERHRWVNDEFLSICAFKSLHVSDKITWFPKKVTAKFDQFAKEIVEDSKMNKTNHRTKKMSDNQSDISDTSLIGNIYHQHTLSGNVYHPHTKVSPGGNKEKSKRFKDLKKCLATVFEAFLAGKFLASNHEIYRKELNNGKNDIMGLQERELKENNDSLKRKHFDVVPSLQFLICFLGNHSIWKKTMRPYMDKYFEVTISRHPFNKNGYITKPNPIKKLHNLKNDSKYNLDVTVCPNCEQKDSVELIASYKTKNKYEFDWRENAMQLSKIFSNKNNQQEINKRVSVFAGQHDMLDNINEYQCNKCQYFIDHNVKIYSEYCTKRMSERSFSTKQIIITPLQKMESDEMNKNCKPPHIKFCDHCQGKMQLMTHSITKRGTFMETQNCQYCDTCELYRYFHQIYKL
eukprot:22305_1